MRDKSRMWEFLKIGITQGSKMGVLTGDYAGIVLRIVGVFGVFGEFEGEGFGVYRR